jgi:hypothetical protein
MAFRCLRCRCATPFGYVRFCTPPSVRCSLLVSIQKSIHSWHDCIGVHVVSRLPPGNPVGYIIVTGNAGSLLSGFSHVAGLQP